MRAIQLAIFPEQEMDYAELQVVIKFQQKKKNPKARRIYEKKQKNGQCQKNEFRYNKARTGHPAYIVEVDGDKVRILGLTEKIVTHKQKNIKLDKNPNPKDKRDAFIRPHTEILEFTDKTFSKKLEGWKFANSDKKKVKDVIVKDNKKRQSRNGKSK